MRKISIIDYGMSNLLSITRAFEYLGAQVAVVKSPQEIINSEILVLPGVGAFPDGMSQLNSNHLVESILEYSAKERPLLGICLGMQMLMTTGYEHQVTNGLNLIKGEVKPLPKNMPGFKVPNINWHRVIEPKSNSWGDTFLKDTVSETNFYFVHSYYVACENDENILAQSRFGDFIFTAAVRSNNVFGTQFHPEKSGEEGLKLLKNFMSL